MCIKLTGTNGVKLAEKCTIGSYGEPFALSYGQNIVVPFKPVNKVKSIRVSFNNGEPGAIRMLAIEGT